MAENSWTRWRAEFAKAVDGSYHSIEAIEASLSAGRCELLDAGDCAFVVEIMRYPNATACQVLWAAGTIEAILIAGDAIHEWARRKGCDEMLIEGHPAWQRALKHRGYEVWSVTLRKPLHVE